MNLNIDSSDFYIEDSVSSFDMLEDSTTEQQIDENTYGAQSYDAIDLIDFEDDEEYLDEIPSKKVEEELEPEDTYEEEHYDEDDDVTIEIDGREIDVNDIYRNIRAKKNIESNTQKLREVIKNNIDSMSDIEIKLEIAKTECESIFSDYEGFDWDGLAASDPSAFIENQEFVEKFKVKYHKILEAQKINQKQKEFEQSQVLSQKAKQTLTTLKEKIEGFDIKYYGTLMEYGISKYGMSEEYVLNCVDPSIFLALNDAYTREHVKKEPKKRVIRNAVGSPKKVVNAQARGANKPSDGKSKQIIAKKIEQGSVEPSDWFNHLED